jgi:hypothetical protein
MEPQWALIKSNVYNNHGIILIIAYQIALLTKKKKRDMGTGKHANIDQKVQ